MSRKKDELALVKDKKLGWVVRISLFSGEVVTARPGTGAQKVIYDQPQKVPRYLKFEQVPKLVSQAHVNNLLGR